MEKVGETVYPDDIQEAFEKNFDERKRENIKEYFNSQITDVNNAGDYIFSWDVDLKEKFGSAITSNEQ